MGVKSTYQVTRDDAISIISRKVCNASNDELADILECFSESTFRNYQVGREIDENELRIIDVDTF